MTQRTLSRAAQALWPQRGRLVVVSAPSGGGKTTVVRHVLAQLPRLLASVQDQLARVLEHPVAVEVENEPPPISITRTMLLVIAWIGVVASLAIAAVWGVEAWSGVLSVYPIAIWLGLAGMACALIRQLQAMTHIDH